MSNKKIKNEKAYVRAPDLEFDFEDLLYHEFLLSFLTPVTDTWYYSVPPYNDIEISYDRWGVGDENSNRQRKWCSAQTI
jgi:hypothetical protein